MGQTDMATTPPRPDDTTDADFPLAPPRTRFAEFFCTRYAAETVAGAQALAATLTEDQVA